MKRVWKPRLAIVLIGASFGLAAAAVTPGVRLILGADGPVHSTTDWSHRHLVFSPPKNLMQQFRLSGNSRYAQQWVRRNSEKADRGYRSANSWWSAPEPNIVPSALHGDWNAYLGINAAGLAGTVGAGNYPAKYSFDTTSASCSDFVVYNTGLAGSTTAFAGGSLATFGAGTPASGQTLKFTNGVLSFTVTSSSSSNTGTNWQTSATSSTDATNLAGAINTNGVAVGVTAIANYPANGQILLRASAVGIIGNSITVTNNVTLLSIPFTNFVDGSSGTPTIVAYDNLYSSCSGPVPAAYWSYVTGTAGAVVTSPVLSADGKQVAFVESTAGAAELVILKWKADGSTVIGPTDLTGAGTVSNASYRSCTAPCMTTINFAGGAAHTDTNSSPFYDYAPGDDAIYVGDNNGSLQKFTGVFQGTPAIGAAPWPVTLTSGNVTTSPVYDENIGNIYIGDSGGFVYKVAAANGAVTPSGRIGHGLGVVDGPIVDPVNEQVYFVTASTGGCGGTNGAVIQFAEGFGSGNTGTNTVTLGSCSSTAAVYDGTFDNAYYSGGAGHMYVCGNAGGNATLYQVSVTATGNLGTTATTGPVLTNATTTCSPVAEIYNPNASGGAKDWIFLSVQNSAVTNGAINCPTNTGCIMSFDVTSGSAISGSTSTVAHTAVAGGASGVVMDNTVSTGTVAGASQVYFTPLSTTFSVCTTSGQQGMGGCAIQASQSGLN